MGAGRRRRTARPFRPHESDGGFGLLEVMIASGVMLTALTSMAYVITNTLYDIAGARQRQTAIALADEAIEQARALPYATVALGVESAYLAGDPRVLGLGTAASPYELATTGEDLVHAPNNQTVAPLVPNVTSRTVDGVVYATRFYVSCHVDDCSTGLLTLTSYVDWSGGRGHRASSVRATSVVYSPSAPDTNSGSVGHGGGGPGGGPNCPPIACPFSGPTPASMSALAQVLPGMIRLSGTGTSGSSLTSTSTQLPSAISVFNRGQVVALHGVGRGGGLVVSGTPLVQPISPTSADDSPVTAAIDDYEHDDATSSTTSASTSAGPGTVSLSFTGAPTIDRSESASAVAASNDDVCRDPAGVGHTDGLPCQRSIGEQAGSLRQLFDLGGLGLGSVTLSDVADPTAPVVAYTKYENTNGSAPCASASGNGCVRAYASRSIGRTRVGGLPSLTALPALFSGYLFELDNYAASASVEAGIGAGVPNVAVASGATLRHWNGLGYTTTSLTASTNLNITTPTITSSLGLYSVSASSTIRSTPSPSPTSIAATCAGPLACVTSAKATLSSPIVATTSYTIKLAGATLFDLTIATDLGDLLVQATYQE